WCPPKYIVCYYLTPHRPRLTLFPYTTLFRSTSSPRPRTSTSKCARSSAGASARDLFFEETPPAGQQRSGNRRLMLSLFVTSTPLDRKSTRLNSSHVKISYAVFCLKKKIQMPL